MFVFELFIITDETTFILAVLMIKLLFIKLRKLKVIVDNYGMQKCRTNVGAVSIDHYCSRSCCYEIKDK